jgi:quinol monooxygenase YgiN
MIRADRHPQFALRDHPFIESCVSNSPFVQIVVSQLKAAATRDEFVELHRQTARWMRQHPDCLGYEVFEGSKGTIADRIVWSSKSGALRGNEEYANSDIATRMQRIVESYSNFFGVPVDLT